MQSRFKAFTLIELVLYLALFSTVILTMVQYFIFVSNKNVDARNRIELSRSVIFLRQHFTQSESEINSFVDGSSTYNSDTGTITFVTNAGNRSYRLLNNNILYNNGSSDIELLASGVTSSKLRFTKITNSANTTIGVHVYVTMTHINIVNDVETFDFLLLSK